MKKVMKFVKGKREDDTIKFAFCDSKRLSTEKIESHNKDDEFICRDKSVTKLHKAVWNENCDKLKSIIKTHDIDITDKFDRTALYFAVLKNNATIVTILLENNANQSIPDIDGITPFLKSVQLGYLKCAQILLDNGADIKRVDKDFNSCTHFAVLEKHVQMLSLLLNRNADINILNSNGECPLHIATRMKHMQIIELLLNHNADMNLKNSDGLSCFALAKQKGDLDVISVFQKRTNKIQKQNNFPSSSSACQLNADLKKVNNSDTDAWNDSPVTSPSRKQNEKYLAKITEHLFSEEVNVGEEKSESDMSVKCSENTSPQSGIIPPPCKPLRSLEYLQSGLTLDNRPVHLLTLGTVRTRHISMTESDHSKNNTPHRYSYQGDFQIMATGDSFTKLPDDKADSVNVSVKSKLLSKLECDSTLQSDWGSNESLPLDESSSGTKKDPKPSTNNISKCNSSCGSLRDKSVDTFLQKQFSILEDYEKNHERHCPVSYDISNNGNNSDSNLDDIDHLLEDNNRINAQLEKYAGQSDILLIPKKSKSLPRNCESFNSYHKGSFSLPRTLEAGKDPFREMRSYGYFKPKSHFFSLKLYKSDRRSGFMDKLKNMFNQKKSQIHLSESAESSGTWLHKDHPQINNDNDSRPGPLKSEHSFSLSENNDLQSSTKAPEDASVNAVRNDFSNLKDLEIDNSSVSLSKHNISKAMEKKILSLSNMHYEHSQSIKSSSSYSRRSNIDGSTNFEAVKKPQKFQRFSDIVSSDDGYVTVKQVLEYEKLVVCDDCSEYVNFKMVEAQQMITSKDNFIKLLEKQLNQLQEKTFSSIKESHENYCKYGLAVHDIIDMKQMLAKNDEELQKLHTKINREVGDAEKVTLKDDDENWKKQLSDLVEQDPSFHENNWHRVLQNEVVSAVSAIRENSESVINALEAQNTKLETIVENLKSDLEQSSVQRRELEHNLTVVTNELLETQSFRNNYERNFEVTIKKLLDNKENLENELKNIKKKYACLQQEYDNKLKQSDNDVKQFAQINSDYEDLKKKNSILTEKLSKFSVYMENLKQQAQTQNKRLKNELKKEKCKNLSINVDEITTSDDSFEIVTVSKDPCTVACFPDQTCDKTLTEDFKWIEENFNLEQALMTIEKQYSEHLENENKNLKDALNSQSKIIEELRTSMYALETQVHKSEQNENEKSMLKNENEKFVEQMEELKSLLTSKDEIINEQKLHLTDLANQKQELENMYNICQSQILRLNNNIATENEVISKLKEENTDLKSKYEFLQKKNNDLSDENVQLRKNVSILKEEKTSVENQLTTTTNEMKDLQTHISNTCKRIENLESSNKELKKEMSELLNKYNSLRDTYTEKDEELKSYKEEAEMLQKHIDTLTEQYEQERAKSDELSNQLDSLKFYHENEISANNARYKEIKLENDSVKLSLQTTLECVQKENFLLRNKIEDIEKEKTELRQNIKILNSEFNNLNKNPETKYNLTVDLRENLNENNTTTEVANPKSVSESKFDTVHPTSDMANSASVSENDFNKIDEHIVDENKLPLECTKDFENSTSKEQIKNDSLTNINGRHNKCSKIPVSTTKSNSFKVKIVTESPKSDNIDYVPEKNEVNCHQSDPEYDSLVDRLNNIETKLHSILITQGKSSSLTSLDKYIHENDYDKCKFETSATQTEFQILRKSSSIECVPADSIKPTNVKNSAEEKFDNNIDMLQNLESQLIEIMNFLISKDEKVLPAVANTEKELDILQNQIQDLKFQLKEESTKYIQLENEFQRFKGETVAKKEMEVEICNLRQQLQKNKSNRDEKEKEAEKEAMQQEFKYELVKWKQKLLTNLTKVHMYLLAKAEEDAIKQKQCEEYLREIEANQQLRRKRYNRSKSPPLVKSKPVDLKGTVRPVKTNVPVLKTHAETCPCALSLPSTSNTCQCRLRIATKVCDVPQPVLLNLARKELNSTVQRHRPKADTSPLDVPEEDLSKIYLME